MKRLEDVMKVVNHHVIIDCCPNPNPGPQNVPAVFAIPHTHTLYMNVGVLLEESDEDGFRVECKVCGSSYLIPRPFLRQEADKILEKYSLNCK